MASSVTTFCLVLASLFVAAFACGNQCRFRLCKLDGKGTLRPKGSIIALRAPKTSITQYVCRDFGPNEELNKITRTAEALVDGTQISKLPVSFKKGYLSLFTIPFSGGLQGIGRDTTSVEQNDYFMPRRCVVLPIRGYEIRNTETGRIRSIATDNRKDCISFQPKSRKLSVELLWENEDDFDLSVEGPSGTGSPANDNIVGQCSSSNPPPLGKETVVYDKADPGEYTVVVVHFEACDDSKKTKFIVRATLDGKLIGTRTGKSNRGDGKTVLRYKFNVPE